MGAALPAAASAHDVQRVKSVEEGIAAFIHEFQALRRDLHQHPELSFQEHRTSAIVAERLASWGYEVTTGIAGTGLVGTLRKGQGTKTLGIRADMDALPITEATGLPYASQNAGVMHACGHDGHTTVLLAAARFLAESGRFDGTLNLIFQPAEENGGGAQHMIADGLFERFPCDAVFGLHNWPCVGAGHFGCVMGPAMASVDQITITVRGKGGHAAMPHGTIDPIVITSQLVGALQTIASRSTDPVEAVVVSVTKFHAGDAYNIIPETAEIAGTVRTLRKEIAKKSEERIRTICEGLAIAFGAKIEVDYQANYPVTFNHPEETVFASDVAIGVAGEAPVQRGNQPLMGGEDFYYMI